VNKKAQEAEPENAERWVLSYADLVTLLLGFFIILFASADVNAQKFQLLARGLSEAFNVDVKEGANGSSPLFNGGGGSGFLTGANARSLIATDLEAIRSAIDSGTASIGRVGEIVVSQDEDRIVIRLSDNLLFPPASADIRSSALPLLAIVARALQDVDEEIRVEGHTDNVPVNTARYPSNWELSSARATAVLRYLTETGDLPASGIFAAGYGEFRPAATNLTPEGRAVNRRADIVVLYPQAQIESVAPAAGPAFDGRLPIESAPIGEVPPVSEVPSAGEGAAAGAGNEEPGAEEPAAGAGE
jgi:chemotaxis protein MotB